MNLRVHPDGVIYPYKKLIYTLLEAYRQAAKTGIINYQYELITNSDLVKNLLFHKIIPQYKSLISNHKNKSIWVNLKSKRTSLGSSDLI